MWAVFHISTSSFKKWRARERMGSAPFLARPDLPSLSFALLWRAAYSSKWGQWRAACPASRRRDGNGKKPAESLTSLHPVKFSSDGLSANFGGLQPSNLQKHSSMKICTSRAKLLVSCWVEKIMGNESGNFLGQLVSKKTEFMSGLVWIFLL